MIDDDFDFEYEELKERYTTLKDQVEYVLQKYPSSRELDELLWWLVFKIFYPELAREFGECAKKGFIPMKILTKVPRFETVSRIRRKFNEQGKYLPKNKEVLKRRKRYEGHWRRLMSEDSE